MNNTEFVDIIGYEGLYKINRNGEIMSMAKEWRCGVNSKRVKTDTLMGISKTENGYKSVYLHNNKKKKYCNIHRLLAIQFIPNPESKREANHINGNKHDNSIENLEWVTSSENRQHAFDTGLKVSPKGKNHWNSKSIMIIYLKEFRTISFPTIIEAVTQTGIGTTTIWNNTHGINKSNKYKFEFI